MKDKVNDIVGYEIRRNMYRGDGIFTLILKEKSMGFYIGLNFMDCISLVDNGVCGGEVLDFEIRELNMKGILLVQKRDLRAEDFSDFWITSSTGNDLNITCKELQISRNLHLYNPISHDKYPRKLSDEELENYGKAH
jgi:hypothetical protein